jgi:hypothetical protein
MKRALRRAAEVTVNELRANRRLYPGLTGNIRPGLTGDISGLWGDISGLTGNIKDAELTAEERRVGVNVNNLVIES